MAHELPARGEADKIAEALRGRQQTVAVAESLTGGMLTNCLAVAEDAATWLRGGLVAYQPEVKHGLLGVQPGPVVTADTAHAMASGALALFDADYSVAVTGVGGPDPDEGKPAGTVWLAVAHGEWATAQLLQLDGEPDSVIRQTCVAALHALLQVIDSSGGAPPER